MATGLSHGLRRGAWSVAGLQIGLMTQLAVVAIGLGAAVAKSVVAFTVIKWVGVLCLDLPGGPAMADHRRGSQRPGNPDVDAGAAGWRCCCAARW